MNERITVMKLTFYCLPSILLYSSIVLITFSQLCTVHVLRILVLLVIALKLLSWEGHAKAVVTPPWMPTIPSYNSKVAWVKTARQNHQGTTITLKTAEIFLSRMLAGAAMQKWGLADSECWDPLESMEHIITSCPKGRLLNGNHKIR